MESRETKKPALINIDKEYKKKINQLQEKYKEDSEHFINRLENKYILILAVGIAVNKKYKPKKAKSSDWIIRTEYLKEESDMIMKSLIFHYVGDLKILLPDNYGRYYEILEGLANAGMEEALEILEDKDELETSLLKKINSRIKDKSQ